jgi:hypothetical protein
MILCEAVVNTEPTENRLRWIQRILIHPIETSTNYSLSLSLTVVIFMRIVYL